MKTVVIGEGAGATMETIMSVYPRHKINADKYIALSYQRNAYKKINGTPFYRSPIRFMCIRK